MFAFDVHGDEKPRLAKLKEEDPIALQDAFNTSEAFLNACKADDLPELQRIMANAVKEDFLQYYVIQGYYAILGHLDYDAFLEIFERNEFPVELFPEALHAVCEATRRETFSQCRRFFGRFFQRHNISVDTPRHKDGFTPLCVSCLTGCMPLSIVLLDEFRASAHVVTKQNLTPYQLNMKQQPGDTPLSLEGRKLLGHKFDSMGVGKHPMEVLKKMKAGNDGRCGLMRQRWAGTAELTETEQKQLADMKAAWEEEQRRAKEEAKDEAKQEAHHSVLCSAGEEHREVVSGGGPAGAVEHASKGRDGSGVLSSTGCGPTEGAGAGVGGGSWSDVTVEGAAIAEPLEEVDEIMTKTARNVRLEASAEFVIN